MIFEAEQNSWTRLLFKAIILRLYAHHYQIYLDDLMNIAINWQTIKTFP